MGRTASGKKPPNTPPHRNKTSVIQSTSQSDGDKPQRGFAIETDVFLPRGQALVQYHCRDNHHQDRKGGKELPAVLHLAKRDQPNHAPRRMPL